MLLKEDNIYSKDIQNQLLEQQPFKRISKGWVSYLVRLAMYILVIVYTLMMFSYFVATDNLFSRIAVQLSSEGINKTIFSAHNMYFMEFQAYFITIPIVFVVICLIIDIIKYIRRRKFIKTDKKCHYLIQHNFIKKERVYYVRGIVGTHVENNKTYLKVLNNKTKELTYFYIGNGTYSKIKGNMADCSYDLDKIYQITTNTYINDYLKEEYLMGVEIDEFIQ